MKLYTLIKIKKIFMPYSQEKLSAKLSYKIYKLIRKIEEDESFFEQKRQELINEYGEKDEHGQLIITHDGMVKIPKELQEEAQQKLSDLSSIDVEMPTCTFTIDELSEIKLSVVDMATLEELIVGDE